MTISSDAAQAFTEIAYVLFDVTAIVLSVVGNSIVIYVMTRDKKLRRTSNYYIILVAVADLLVGSIGIPCCIYMVSFQ